MTLCADARGALFDVPVEKIDYFEKTLASAMESANNKVGCYQRVKPFLNSCSDFNLPHLPRFDDCYILQESFLIDVATTLPELNDARLVVHGAPASSSKNPLSRGGKRRRTDNASWNPRESSKWQRTQDNCSQRWSRK